MNFVKTDDGTNTLYSKEFDEHYHSLSDGALNESLKKHVEVAFRYLETEDNEINILDICFGLGYNTLATIYYIERNSLFKDKKINIYSPELDLELIKSLKNFHYPSEFDSYKKVIESISDNLEANYKNFNIFVGNRDAREFIKKLDIKFDIIYQDAFSSLKNPTLWSFEYFSLIKEKMKKKSLITTYSIATNVRLSIYENDLYIYECNFSKKKSTIALNYKIDLKAVDMERKKRLNPEAKALFDKNLKKL